MKRLQAHRYAALVALGCVMFPGVAGAAKAQEDGSPTAILLGRARTLEQRGRLDLAKQDWAQVLLLDPNDAEALAGLVRALRAEGKSADAAQYLAKLKATHPQTPEIARLEAGSRAQGDTTADLAEAKRLEQAGDARGAFAIYRRIYGLTPPSGSPALAYYHAEAGTQEGRAQAIAGLRAFADRYPNDQRYQVELGKLLLGSARTQAEGRTLLEGMPQNTDAVNALRAAGVNRQTAEATGEPTAGAIGAPKIAGSETGPKRIPAPVGAAGETQNAQRATTAVSAAQQSASAGREAGGVVSGRPAITSGTAVRHASFAAQEQAGFTALNAHRADEAERLFQGVLAQDPTNPRALAGLGYLRQVKGDFRGAVQFFERAQENGDRSLALTRALVTAQFNASLQQADSARVRGDLPSAESSYRAALRERPSDPEALAGLGQSLLQSGHAGEAAPVFSKLTEVRPLDPEAWRGLVIADASLGKGTEALAADAKIPQDAKAPLLQDASYQQALATARHGASVTVARNEPVSPLPLPRPPAASTLPEETTRAAAAATSKALPPAAVPPVTARADSSPPTASTAGGRASAAVLPKPKVAAPVSPASSAAQGLSAQSALPQTSASNQGNQHDKRAPRATATGHPGKRSVAQPNSPAITASALPPPQPTPTPPASAPVAVTIARERTVQGQAALRAGNLGSAGDLFRAAVASDPNQPDAWRGLVEALHSSGRDADAVSSMTQMPSEVRLSLDRDATFEATVGNMYLRAGRPEQSLRAFVKAQEIFASQHLAPPLELSLQVASLLAAKNDEANLYRQLMYLGERRDLNDMQRRDVQMIWTRWAVRRARLVAFAGDQRRAVTVLNAAAEAFAGNPEVISVVADGYTGIGLPREAVALYKAKDLSSAPAREIEAAIVAGTAAHDWRAAEGWSRVGRQRFPADPEMLNAYAQLEQARGRQDRAAEIARQAKAVAPAQNPGDVLLAELREAEAGVGWQRRAGGQLATLLAPSDAVAAASTGSNARPFLPTPVADAGQQATDKTPVLVGFDEPTR